MNIEAQLVETISSAVQDLVHAVLALPSAAIFGIAVVPLCLAILSRNVASVSAAAAMSMLSYSALMSGSHSKSDAILATAIYIAALLAGLLGHGEARHAQRFARTSQDIDRLRLEMHTFLEAIDQRSLALDQFTRRESPFSHSEPSDRAKNTENVQA
ncbi:hypothetical protein [Microvirga subterranea]|uniref:hypothetical protein n=1 Tax=Microvirga subterranea TaxID=186651 RepID=UPI000E0A04B1|nr:hypothetical protein [Microvirga subterranea]